MFAGRHVGQASVTRDPSHRRPSPTPRNTMSGGFATRFLLEVDELLNQVRVGVVTVDRARRHATYRPRPYSCIFVSTGSKTVSACVLD